MSANRLIYLPIGGAGEVGMNCYVYGYGPAQDERLIVIDRGVTFPDMGSSPGVDLIMPDMTWLEENRDRIEAIQLSYITDERGAAEEAIARSAAEARAANAEAQVKELEALLARLRRG